MSRKPLKSKAFTFFALSSFTLALIASQALTPSPESKAHGALYITIEPTPVYHAFGDSITAGFEISPVTFAYPWIISFDKGFSMTNYGTNGMAAADMADQEIFPNENPQYDFFNPVYTAMIGTNDANGPGAGAYEGVYTLTLQAGLSWLAISQKYKTFGQSSSGTHTGVWSNDNTYQTGIGFKTAVLDALLNLPIITTGGNLYIWYRIMDGNGGVLTYWVDSGAATNVNCFTSPPINTPRGDTQSVGLVRITNVPPGNHIVHLQQTAQSNPSNVLSVLAVGTTSGIFHDPYPKVFVGGVIRQANGGKDSDTAAYNADALASVSLLQSDGLNIFFADTRSAINNTTDMGDQLHPNAGGQNKIGRNAFEPVMAVH